MSPFADYSDFDDCVSQNQDKDSPEGFCAWLQHETTGEWPSVKSVDEAEGVYLAGPIVHKNEALKIITGPVLVPGEKDTDGEVVGEKKIEEVALKYMEDYGMVDVDHTFNQVATPVESWLTRKQESFVLPDGKVLVAPKGTWMLSVKVKSEKVWQGVLSGIYKGFSIAGIRKADIERAMKSDDPSNEFTVALKRKTLLRDLGEDWVGIAVSIVKSPAVYKSKMGWIAVKSVEPLGLLSRLWNRLNTNVDMSTKNKTEDTMEDKEKKELEGIITAAVKAAVAEAKTEPAKTEPEVKTETKTKLVKTESKTDPDKTEPDKSEPSGVDFSGKINEYRMKLLKIYETEDSDEKTKKISDLQAQVKMLEKMERDSKPKNSADEVTALKTEMDELKKKLDGGVSTKSRGIEDQSGPAKKDEDKGKDKYPRDISGCRIS